MPSVLWRFYEGILVMKLRYVSVSLLAMSVGLSACGDEEGSDFSQIDCGDVAGSNCVEIQPGDVEALMALVNGEELADGTTIILGEGTYMMPNVLQLEGASDLSLIGQGIDKTVLDFSEMVVQDNGVFATGTDGILVQDFTVVDAVKDGIRIENSDGVTFRRIRATWTTEGDSTNGAYGIYPVRVSNVLVEDSYAENASDAGLYVGQCQHAIIRNNVVRGNVAGLEIENTQYADVYGNLAEDNTGGIVVFDLPGNPIVGRDVRIFDNVIRNNNRRNFAPTGVVKEIPAGTGTFALSSRRVEITNNTYEGNQTVDIAIINGLLVEGAVADWSLVKADLVGDWEDLDLPVGQSVRMENVAGDGEEPNMQPVLDEEGQPVYDDDPDKIANNVSENIVISGNTHSGSGTKPDAFVEFGQGLIVAYGMSVPNVMYEMTGESSFDPEDASAASNDNHICVGGNTNGNMGIVSLDTSSLAGLTLDGFGPFDCDTLLGAPIEPVTLEGR